jgi:hypothetical protein
VKARSGVLSARADDSDSGRGPGTLVTGSTAGRVQIDSDRVLTILTVLG